MTRTGAAWSDELASRRKDLLRYVHRLTGDADLAEDIAQEALIRFVTGNGSSPVLSPRAWLFRVATNLVRDHLRNAAMRQRYSPLLEPATGPTPEQELERRQAIDHVRRVLDRLSPRDRELLILRESGFRYREIAEVVNVKTESIPTLMARAVSRFRLSYNQEAGHGAPH